MELRNDNISMAESRQRNRRRHHRGSERGESKPWIVYPLDRTFRIGPAANEPPPDVA
jgi:hypothetical protein